MFDADAGVALTFYGLLTAAPGDFNFQGIGQGIAVWNNFDSLPSRPLPGNCAESPTLLFCADEPAFGAAAVISADLLYSFGCPRDGLSFHCLLAQVPVSAALDKTRWRYWNGSSFSPELSSAVPLFDAASILFVFFNVHVGRWMVIYAQNFSNQVVMRTAPQLTGPWSAEGNLFTADRGPGGGDTYDALVHPELSEQDGKILYVTFSRSTGLFNSELALVRVELQ